MYLFCMGMGYEQAVAVHSLSDTRAHTYTSLVSLSLSLSLLFPYLVRLDLSSIGAMIFQFRQQKKRARRNLTLPRGSNRFERLAGERNDLAAGEVESLG
jgi:lauroyl/myristoyl acyltransferase